MLQSARNGFFFSERHFQRLHSGSARNDCWVRFELSTNISCRVITNRGVEPAHDGYLGFVCAHSRLKAGRILSSHEDDDVGLHTSLHTQTSMGLFM